MEAFRVYTMTVEKPTENEEDFPMARILTFVACAVLFIGAAAEAAGHGEEGPELTEEGLDWRPLSRQGKEERVTFLEDGHRSRPTSEIDQIRSWIGAGALDN